VFAQFGEDGITIHLLNNVDLKPSEDGTYFSYVEFGTESGSECNTRILRESYHELKIKEWKGLLMDGRHENHQINLHQEMITPDNIVALLEKHGVHPSTSDDIAYFSEDTDMADYYIWRSIFKSGYKPRVLVSEINGNFHNTESYTTDYPGKDVPRFWTGNTYFGMSALALKYLWNRHDYIIVYCTLNQVNCFGVRKDLIKIEDQLSQNIPKEIMYRKLQQCLWDGAYNDNKALSWQEKIPRCDENNYRWVPVNKDGTAAHEKGENEYDNDLAPHNGRPQFQVECMKAAGLTPSP
jgi:hypothetical protein